VTPSRTLARDYKHVRRNTSGGQPFNGWMGLLIGLSIGLAVALGVFLHYRNPPPAQPTPEAVVPPASAQASEPEGPAPAGPANEYDFYDMLKNQEVEVPATASATPAAAMPAGLRGDVTLQVGSFKGQDQAEKMQARLALHGLESRIQRFTLQDETWYRVRIGPIGTVEELDAVRAKLAEAEVEATAVSSEVVEAPPP
jgi:cell division protein FtsN